MASGGTSGDHGPRPALAFTYAGDDAELLRRVLPLIDIIEISPDAIATSDGRRTFLRPEVLAEYCGVAGQVSFVAHGIGLSIGSFDKWEEGYLRLLDQLFAQVDLSWHSEHLAFTHVAGENTGTMFPMPRTKEAIELICDRVRRVQECYKVPFLLEHVIHLLPDAPADFTPAGFLNAIHQRTGCGLILDAYNLECDVHNRGVDAKAFFDELNFEPVTELHVAGGTRYQGFQLDIHSDIASDETLALAGEIIQRAPNLRAVTFEVLKETAPLLGHDRICGELVRWREVIAAKAAAPAVAA